MRSRRAVGIMEPCLPSPAPKPLSGRDWIHEIKHDGFRILALAMGRGFGSSRGTNLKCPEHIGDADNYAKRCRREDHNFGKVMRFQNAH